MTIRLRLVTGDTPQIVLPLADKHTGEATDVSDPATTVRFKSRPAGASGPVTVITCSKLSGREIPGGIDYTPPYDQLGKGGRVLASCDANVFSSAGEYEAEVEITFGAVNQVATPYEQLRISVRGDFD